MTVRPSLLHRLDGCPGSRSLMSLVPADPGGDAAQRGKRLHSCVERILVAARDCAIPGLKTTLKDAVDQSTEEAGKDLPAVHWATRTAQSEMNRVQGARILTEQTLLTSKIHPALNDGTGDLALVVPFDRGTLVDWKFGARKQTPAVRNLQTGAYAVALADEYQLTEVRVVIAYPMFELVDSVTLDERAIDDARSRIKLVIDQSSSPFAPLRLGPWCRYCPALTVCPAAAKIVEEMIGAGETLYPQDVSTESLPDLLDIADLVQSWASAVKRIGYARAATGEYVQGWRLRETKRRKWAEGVDVASVTTALSKAGKEIPFTAAIVQQAKSPNQIESLVGRSKTVRDALAPLIDYTTSTTLVREENPKEQGLR